MGNSRSRSYYIWPWRSQVISPMAGLTVPAKLEEALALEDGSQGPPLSPALHFDQREVPNLYSCTADGEFRFGFTDNGVAYGETESTQRQAAITFKVRVSPQLLAL